MSVYLIGYRGAGKTTIGRKLADRLWMSFADSDERVIQQAGKTIREIFDQHGEPTFRDLESKIVLELSKLSDHVIALGGGALLSDANREALSKDEHKIVYLRCDPEELHRRIQADPQTAANRPNLTPLGGSVDEIKNLLVERESLYRSCMTAELDVTNLSPEEAVTRLGRLV
jgi:shikimate kinase